MKKWYYKFVKLKGVRKFVNLISWIIRGLAVLDGVLVTVLQLDVFDNIITRINALFNASWTSIEVKTNLYIWLAFFVGTELLLRGIRYILKAEVSLIKAEKNKLRKINKDLDKRVKLLQDDCKFLKENYQNTISGYLQSFATNKLGFGKDGHYEDRITLFTYDRGNEEFILQGRYSPNDKYCENGKFVYPKNGLLYKAFNTDEGVYDDGFPKPFIDGTATITDNYWKYHKKKYGLTKEVVQNLTMKPTIMYGYVIKDHSEGDKIGVVIVESTERNRFNKDELLHAIEDERKIFRNFIKHGHDLLRKNLKSEGL